MLRSGDKDSFAMNKSSKAIDPPPDLRRQIKKIADLDCGLGCLYVILESIKPHPRDCVVELSSKDRVTASTRLDDSEIF